MDMAHNQRLILLVSIAFLILYTAIFELQNTQTYLLYQAHYASLGFTSNGICQLFQGLAALCSAFLIQKHGPKRCLALPSLLCLLNIAAFYFPLSLYTKAQKRTLVQTLLCLSAALNGVGQGLNQTAVGVFI